MPCRAFARVPPRRTIRPDDAEGRAADTTGDRTTETRMAGGYIASACTIGARAGMAHSARPGVGVAMAALAVILSPLAAYAHDQGHTAYHETSAAGGETAPAPAHGASGTDTVPAPAHAASGNDTGTNSRTDPRSGNDQPPADTKDAATATAQDRLPRIILKAGKHRIEAEVAATGAHHERGLMYRTSMPKDHGMLFEFEAPGIYCFWMRNTLIPLTVAFMDASGRIIGLTDMQPRDEHSHCPPAPVHRALEMNQGWFAEHGVNVGDVIQPAD